MHQINLDACRTGFSPQEVNESLRALYALLGAAHEDSFHFTTGAGSAQQQIFFSHYVDCIRQTGRNHILTVPSSEMHTQRVLKQIELFGAVNKPLSLNGQGQLTKQALEEAIRARSSLLSLSWVHGLTGVIQPIHELIEVCRQNNVRVHLDATFALGALFFRFKDLGVDFLSFDGALLKAPLGTGGFLLRAPLALFREQEMNSSGLAALVRSIDTLMHHFDHLATETARLRDKFEKGIQEGYPEAHLFFQNVERLPNCAVIAFPGIASDTLHYLLQKKGIHASQGGGYFPSLSSILISYGIAPALAHTALSFTLFAETTDEEIERAIAEVVTLAKKIRFWAKEIA